MVRPFALLVWFGLLWFGPALNRANSNPEVEVYSYVNLVLLDMTLRSSGGASAATRRTPAIDVWSVAPAR
jgi:hypothetical protein